MLFEEYELQIAAVEKRDKTQKVSRGRISFKIIYFAYISKKVYKMKTKFIERSLIHFWVKRFNISIKKFF
jgi:hypothetical protein